MAFWFLVSVRILLHAKTSHARAYPGITADDAFHPRGKKVSAMAPCMMRSKNQAMEPKMDAQHGFCKDFLSVTRPGREW